MTIRHLLAAIAGTASLLVLPSAAAAFDLAEFSTVDGDPIGLQLVLDSPADDPNAPPVNRKWVVQQNTNNFVITAPADGWAPDGGGFTSALPVPDGNQCDYSPTPGDINTANAVICTPTDMSQVKGVTIYAGDGSDEMDASDVELTVRLYGELGGDFLIGGKVGDLVAGGDGDDYLLGGCGVDSYHGGSGNDAASFFMDFSYCPGRSGGVTLSLDNVANDGHDNENIGSPSTNSVELLHGTDLADNLTGAGSPDGIIPNIYANGGDDTINVRNGVKDMVNCGEGTGNGVNGGTDTVTADDKDVDPDMNFTWCETVNRPTPTGSGGGDGGGGTGGGGGGTFYPVINMPTKYTDVGGSCASGQKSKDVNGIKFCFNKEKQLSGGTKYELTGLVNIGGFLYFNSNVPVVIDTKAKAGSLKGKAVVEVMWGGTRYPVYKSDGEISFNLTAKTFTMNATSSWPMVEVAKQKLSFITQNKLIAGAGAVAQKFTVDTANRTITYPAGASFLGGAITTSGTVGYSATQGLLANVIGCMPNGVPLPVGGASRIAEIHNACISYDKAKNTWSFSGKAKLLSSIEAVAGATVINGQLDAFNAQFSGFGRAPMPFGGYIDGGGINVGGLRGTPYFSGTVTGGWPIQSGGLADLKITGTVGFHTGTRVLTISGNGVLQAGGQQLANGNISLQLGFGSPSQAAGFKASAYVNALGGFITGGIVANIDGSGFFASGTMTLGFLKDAAITNQVNTTIRNTLHCEGWYGWVYLAWCPYVTGKSMSAQAVVSSKGVGAKTTIVWFHASVWWLAQTRQFGYDLGFNGSKDLSVVLQQRQREVVGRNGRIRVEHFAESKPMSWDIPKGVQLASLQLEGSTTGDLLVKDPNGRVVLDTAKQLMVEGVGWGRDPDGAGKASLGLFPPAIKPGTWTVTTSGAAPFSKISPILATEPESGKVTAVTPIGKGVKPNVRKLTAGTSRLKLTYAPASGTKLGLRASNGTTSIAIASGITGKGSRVWKVPANWAGKLQILAVTEREGVPTDTTTFPTTFTVVQPKLAKATKLKAVRTGTGKLTVTWKPVKGAVSYDVELLVGSAKVGVPVNVKKVKVVLNPRSAAAMRVRVRPVSALGTPGAWSSIVKIAAVTAKPKKPKKPKK